MSAGIRRDGTLKSHLSGAALKSFFGSVTSTGNRAYAGRLAADFSRLEDLKHCQDLASNGQEKIVN